jgi:sulfite oxidase
MMTLASIDDSAARAKLPPVDASNPFARDPVRHPALKVRAATPFNAETPAELISGTVVAPSTEPD